MVTYVTEMFATSLFTSSRNGDLESLRNVNIGSVVINITLKDHIIFLSLKNKLPSSKFGSRCVI